MKVEDIHNDLRELAEGGDNIYIPEFTYRGLRIDAVIVDIHHRWIRGFEIKTRRQDFLADYKWQLYSSFCSSLSIVCPTGLIQPEEITKPFGLLWLGKDLDSEKTIFTYYHWKKRPKKFNHRNSLAWTWIYLGVLEMELPRLVGENRDLTKALKKKEGG